MYYGVDYENNDDDNRLATFDYVDKLVFGNSESKYANDGRLVTKEYVDWAMQFAANFTFNVYVIQQIHAQYDYKWSHAGINFTDHDNYLLNYTKVAKRERIGFNLYRDINENGIEYVEISKVVDLLKKKSKRYKELHPDFVICSSDRAGYCKVDTNTNDDVLLAETLMYYPSEISGSQGKYSSGMYNYGNNVIIDPDFLIGSFYFMYDHVIYDTVEAVGGNIDIDKNTYYYNVLVDKVCIDTYDDYVVRNVYKSFASTYRTIKFNGLDYYGDVSQKNTSLEWFQLCSTKSLRPAPGREFIIDAMYSRSKLSEEINFSGIYDYISGPFCWIKYYKEVSWDLFNITTFNRMFYMCKHTTSLNLSNFPLTRIVNKSQTYDMFSECNMLNTIYMSDELFGYIGNALPGGKEQWIKKDPNSNKYEKKSE